MMLTSTSVSQDPWSLPRTTCRGKGWEAATKYIRLAESAAVVKYWDSFAKFHIFKSLPFALQGISERDLIYS